MKQRFPSRRQFFETGGTGKEPKPAYEAIITGKSSRGLAATASKRMSPEKGILVIDKKDLSRIPWVFGTLDSVDDNMRTVCGTQNSGRKNPSIKDPPRSFLFCKQFSKLYHFVSFPDFLIT